MNQRIRERWNGGGSLVDLHSRASFLNANGLSSLNATNGGEILSSGQPFFLLGGTATVPGPGSGLPPVSLTNASKLVLFGIPWRQTRRTTHHPRTPIRQSNNS